MDVETERRTRRQLADLTSRVHARVDAYHRIPRYTPARKTSLDEVQSMLEEIRRLCRRLGISLPEGVPESLEHDG